MVEGVPIAESQRLAAASVPPTDKFPHRLCGRLVTCQGIAGRTLICASRERAVFEGHAPISNRQISLCS